ncbi:MAG: polyphosphate kinase 2 family protein [Candidatus Symbiothrix sp.]|jgi:PPK2 family polyphosphate:nucleotide phosphotransferase|nr:polyphosphate kinase 2 family protein [Candidatus Symbiothrix sp.]
MKEMKKMKKIKEISDIKNAKDVKDVKDAKDVKVTKVEVPKKKTDWLKKLVAEPGKKHEVKNFKTDYTGGFKKKESQALLAANIEKLAQLQDKFYAYDKYSLLIVVQAMDAAGKDGTIKHVMSGINPQGCQVFSFKQPSREELDHSYLWRIVKNMPERGRIGIFNRSHYEDVLVSRVHPEYILNSQLPNINSLNDINEKFWENRYRQINDFERSWVENGTIILKFFLNVSQEEQEKRLSERLNNPDKIWKLSESDLKERAYWKDYMSAFSDMLSNTSTEYAPWHVIPADNKWFMRYAVGSIITDTMEKLPISYPKISEEERKKLAENLVI